MAQKGPSKRNSLVSPQAVEQGFQGRAGGGCVHPAAVTFLPPFPGPSPLTMAGSHALASGLLLSLFSEGKLEGPEEKNQISSGLIREPQVRKPRFRERGHCQGYPKRWPINNDHVNYGNSHIYYIWGDMG